MSAKYTLYDLGKYLTNIDILLKQIPILLNRKIMAQHEKDTSPEQNNSVQKQNSFSARDVLDFLAENGTINTDAPTSITRLNSDWKTHYSKNPIIDIPIKDLTKLDLDIWVHKFIQEQKPNKTKVYELSPLALLFMFQTGLRLGEVCVVRYSDIESADRIRIHSMYRRQTEEVVEYTKGNSEERKVYLSNTAKKLIEAARVRQKEYGVKTDFIFSINDLPLTERSIADLYRKYCKKLGIMQKSSHKARKTYISSLIDSGVNINTVREMSGHSSEKTTYRNYVFDRSTETEKIEKFESALSY